jgi:Transposase DDE domain group 1
MDCWDELTACLRDQRQAGKVNHGLRELLAQRVFSIACGYPDANDSARFACGSSGLPGLRLVVLFTVTSR